MRVHAQVVTPGVIFNSEHLVEYGESEEGVIKCNQEFLEDYKKLCEKLNIREVTVTDKTGKEHDMIGHPEIKGVRGIDKRKYLFDLIHLFPRDTNFTGTDNQGCLLRPELVREYQLKLIYNKINTDYSEEMKKLNETDQNAIKDPQSYYAYMEEKYKKKDELYEKINNEIKPLIKLDTTLYTENKYLTFNNKHKDQDEKLLKKLSAFLKEDTLAKFLADINKEEESPPSDSASLTEYIHKYGINCRYYGELLKQIDSDSNNKRLVWVKTLILRDILKRCAKHIFNSLTLDIPEYLLKDVTAYFLNVLLSPASLIKNLESFDIAYVNGAITTVKPSDNANVTGAKDVKDVKEDNTLKKKKKNKNKKNKNKKKGEDLEVKFLINENLSNKLVNSLFEIKDLDKYFIKPSEFWSKMKEIAQIRYGYTFSDISNYDYIELAINKFGLLRDFCLCVGIQIEALDYELYYDNLRSKNEFKYTSMPFKTENVTNFFPVVKDYNLPSEIHRPIFEQAEAMFKGANFLEAADKFKQILYLSNEICGPINHYSGVAHKKLAEISYLEGDYMSAIAMLQKSIIINEKLYSYDSNVVANSYAELSTYYHLIGQEYLAFKHIFRALEIINFSYPKNHPDIVNRMCNLAMYYVDMDLIENAKELIESTMKLCGLFFEEDDRNVL